MNQDELRRDIIRCREDFSYFSEKYLKIITKDSELKALVPNPSQIKIVDSIRDNDHMMLLKARQLGSTTIIAAYFFWHTLFNKYTRTAIVAHTDEAVRKIFEIYHLFHEHLPPHLKLETSRSRENEIKFITGSSIRVGSASSQSFRGSTYNLIHASEYAFWTNMEKAIASLFGARTKNAKIVLESTANGMNEAYDLWSSESGYSKMFLSWKLDADYILEKPKFNDPTEEELEYSYKNKLTKPQFNWMINTLRTACANNWNIFNQEYPSEPTDAFVATGAPFFPDNFDVLDSKDGYIEYMKPKKFGVYAMGVDTATGSPGGDYSAFMILDVTDRKNIRMAASYYERIPPSLYARKVVEYARRYNAFLVIETNSYGLAVQDHVQGEGHPFMYRTSSFDKVTNAWQNRLGFMTTSKSRPMLYNRLYEYITRGWCNTTCPRFRTEANRLQYNGRGKVEAAPGQHDDMVMATGLALMGLDQVDDIEEEVKKTFSPDGIRGVIEWEMHTGRLWSSSKKSEFAKDSGDEILGAIGDLL
tara:strand:+ start:2260 stop:3852 length:1593 start_codon:yes stop_codon:yes gene_type:complete